MGNRFYFVLSLLGLLVTFCQNSPSHTADPTKIISYTLNTKEQPLQFFHKNEKGIPFLNHGKLKDQLERENKSLVFAMNGGMYNKDFTPQGLYIEQGKVIAPLDVKEKGYGNFYLQPNGVFYLAEDNKPNISTTSDFKYNNSIQYATQSGPMLLIGGKVHPKFREGSSNVHIRNGVGLLPNGELLFAMSKERICFYDFATYFKSRGCKDALYLDGFVSRTYLPEKNWEQLDGKYGIIIAEVNAK